MPSRNRVDCDSPVFSSRMWAGLRGSVTSMNSTPFCRWPSITRLPQTLMPVASSIVSNRDSSFGADGLRASTIHMPVSREAM